MPQKEKNGLDYMLVDVLTALVCLSALTIIVVRALKWIRWESLVFTDAILINITRP